jgi:hypothetical protein
MLKDTVATLIENKAAFDKWCTPTLAQLKDKNIPLDERWEAYGQLCKAKIITKIAPYGDGFVDTLYAGGCCYDDLHIEKYQTSDYFEMAEDNFEGWGDTPTPTPKRIAKWKEEVLASGDAGFTYDW